MKNSNLQKLFLLIILALSFHHTFSQKEVYIPSFITRENIDLNDQNSQWCYCRSIETENIVVFWEPGFGDDPSTAGGDYAVNMTDLLQVAEKSYAHYMDSLNFAEKGSSVADDYKLMIFLLHSTEWAAYGSGQDDLVGTLHVNPAAARSSTVLAHEIGHCFQYITGCDTDGGYRYGLGINGAGGNGFWEQCANWMAFDVYPESKFTTHDFNNYIRNNHLHILHEEPRYANYFIQDYWTYKRGQGFIGTLWRESRFPEDPVETYKRLNSISQEEFNDEMYEHAARLTTFDLPKLRNRGTNYINRRAQVAMELDTDNYWEVNPSVTIQNYGYNSIKLNAPSEATTVEVSFKGIVGQENYRSINTNNGGWRFGFVALLEDGTRVYSDVRSANIQAGINPEETLSFMCPDNCTNLWLVVSGAPQQHWKHEWDDDESNDEQWPFEVQFENTNLLGVYNAPIKDLELTYEIQMTPQSDYTSIGQPLSTSKISEAFAMPLEEIANEIGNSITFFAEAPNGNKVYNSTANAPGHWFDIEGDIVAWGNESYVFSEWDVENLIANIGQYPNRCESGDTFTIVQGMTYQKSDLEQATITVTFNITVSDEIITTTKSTTDYEINFFPNPTTGMIYLSKNEDWTVLSQEGEVIIESRGKTVDLTDYPSGFYILRIDGKSFKIMKL